VNGTGGSGVTLIEILVALVLLAVGAAALSAWQLSALQLAARARQQQQLVALVEAELSFRALVALQGPDCGAQPELPAGVSCSVSEEACQLVGAALTCGPAGPVPARIRRITVRAAPDSGSIPALELSSVVAEFAAP
jgi:prepilin-type N-terminal cleavage/methylation domain-containing protein